MMGPAGGAILMLGGGFNMGGGFEIFILGAGARIIGLIYGGCNGFALASRLIGTLIGGGFGVVKPKPTMGPESSFLTVGSNAYGGVLPNVNLRSISSG